MEIPHDGSTCLEAEKNVKASGDFPDPVPVSTGEWKYLYGRAFGVEGVMDRNHRQLFADVGTDLAAIAPEAIIDLGCGNGRFSLAVSARASTPTISLLLDKDRDLLSTAVAGHLANGSRAWPLLADVDFLPFPETLEIRRPAVLLSHVLYYSRSWPYLLSRVLRMIEHSNGCCVIVTRTRRSDSYRLRRAVRSAQNQENAAMVQSEVVAEWLTDHDVPFLSRMTRTDLPVPLPHGSEAALRDLLFQDSELRGLLALVCHQDPCTMDVSSFTALARSLAPGPEGGTLLSFENEALIAWPGSVT
ncbi:hypothetical protein ACSDR0_25185 [Streptosporangium sp. G11]|uniref:hypothetical protein n=1 Tax=Streptosporangium sp. G11 TaxID=3436926 RepID=UPI003EBC2864